MNALVKIGEKILVPALQKAGKAILSYDWSGAVRAAGETLRTKTPKFALAEGKPFTWNNFRAQFTWRNVGDFVESKVRAGYTIDQTLFFADMLLHSDEYESRGDFYKDAAWTGSASTIGLASILTKSKKSPRMKRALKGAMWLHAASSLSYNIAQAMRDPSEKEIAEELNRRKNRNDCKDEIALAALKAQLDANGFLASDIQSTKDVAFDARFIPWSAKSGGQFFRVQVQLAGKRTTHNNGKWESERNNNILYGETKYSPGMMESMARTGFWVNSDSNAANNNFVGSSKIKSFVQGWDNDAFLGLQAKASFRPRQVKITTHGNGEERETEFKFALFGGISNFYDTRSAGLEQSWSLKLPGSFNPKDLFNKDNWRYERNLRLQYKAGYNPLIIQSGSGVQTKSSWDFLQEVLFLKKSDDHHSGVRILADGIVADEKTPEGRKKIANYNAKQSSQHGLLVSEYAHDLTGDGFAHASAVNFQLPQNINYNSISTVITNSEDGSSFYEIQMDAVRGVQTQKLLAFMDKNNKTYFTAYGAQKQLHSYGQEKSHCELLSIDHQKLYELNKSAFRSFNVGGQRIEMIGAGYKMNIDAVAQGSVCNTPSEFTGLFVRGVKRVNTPAAAQQPIVETAPAAPQKPSERPIMALAKIGQSPTDPLYGLTLQRAQPSAAIPIAAPATSPWKADGRSVSQSLLDLAGETKVQQLIQAWGLGQHPKARAVVAKRLTEIALVKNQQAGRVGSTDNIHALQAGKELDLASIGAMDIAQINAARLEAEREFNRIWGWKKFKKAS